MKLEQIIFVKEAVSFILRKQDILVKGVISFIMKKQDNFLKEVVSFLKKLLVSWKQMVYALGAVAVVFLVAMFFKYKKHNRYADKFEDTYPDAK